MSKFWTEDVLGVLIGMFIVACVLLGITTAVWNAKVNGNREETRRTQILVTACKTVPDPQTCMELVQNKYSTIINQHP